MQGVTDAEMNARQRAIAAEIARGPRGRVGTLMRLWLHSPDVAEHAQRLGGYFRLQDNVPGPLVEMVILLTARKWRCEYEWVQHEPAARAKGLDDAIIEAIRREARPPFTDPAAAAVFDFAAAMLDRHGVDDATFSRLMALYGPRGIVDLSVLIGHYIHGAILLNAAGVGRGENVDPPFPTAAAPAAE
ncbi:MAG TPA: carboxymuconolactone decarboxylase family protein [Xanthobacteraceae bacterium]|nr:carboxymuconolactone decarboxylase family protein [Xanthobacteraceae bacterium]